MRGCIGYHFDGLLSQLLVALHPLVLFTAMWLTSEDAGYDWVRGDVTECIGVHVFISVESLHCFLVGWCANKSYVIATSDLWLHPCFQPAFPQLPIPTPLHKIGISPGRNWNCDLCNQDFKSCQHWSQFWFKLGEITIWIRTEMESNFYW